MCSSFPAVYLYGVEYHADQLSSKRYNYDVLTMNAQLTSAVEDHLESSNTGETITLIVGVEDSTSDDVVEQVTATGAEIEERLPYDSLAVSIEEDDLQALCSLDVITTVEIEGEWKQLGEQDFRSHTRLIL